MATLENTSKRQETKKFRIGLVKEARRIQNLAKEAGQEAVVKELRSRGMIIYVDPKTGQKKVKMEYCK